MSTYIATTKRRLGSSFPVRRTPLPRPELNPYKREIDAFLPEDGKLVGYSHHPAIPAPIAV
jgi:thymidylate synthase